MAERQLLFTLNYEQFTRILANRYWFNLQHEFEKVGYSLSQSFLILHEETGEVWRLVDFETKKTYDIRREVKSNESATETELVKVQISELFGVENQLIGLSDPKSIFTVLVQSPQGTDEGFIDFVTNLNFVTVDDLRDLRRSELSPAGFSFEYVYPDLLLTHKILHEILTAPRGYLLDLSFDDFQQFMSYLTEFHDKIQKIGNFDPRGDRPEGIESPEEYHSQLLSEISGYCETVRNALSKTLTYLRSQKVERLENQVETTLTDAEGKFNTEAEKIQKLGEESQENEKKRQEIFEELQLQLQNQLTAKSRSEYQVIFKDQAQKHQKMSWIWLAISVGLAVGFGIYFWELLLDVGSLATQENQLSMILSNLFAKGFYLSLIFLFLNRTIKNFAAEKHLEVVNTHRHNALGTFDVFVAAAEGNRETRDAVLLAATKAIFDTNQSGYLSTKTSGSDSASPVQQIIKEVIPTKSSGKGD